MPMLIRHRTNYPSWSKQIDHHICWSIKSASNSFLVLRSNQLLTISNNRKWGYECRTRLQPVKLLSWNYTLQMIDLHCFTWTHICPPLSLCSISLVKGFHNSTNSYNTNTYKEGEYISIYLLYLLQLFMCCVFTYMLTLSGSSFRC
jgi:hypothetical protein